MGIFPIEISIRNGESIRVSRDIFQVPHILGGISRDGALWRRPTYSHQFRHAFEWLGHDLVMTWSWSLLLHDGPKWSRFFSSLTFRMSHVEPLSGLVSLPAWTALSFWSSKPVAASHRILSFLVLFQGFSGPWQLTSADIWGEDHVQFFAYHILRALLQPGLAWRMAMEKADLSCPSCRLT